MFPERFLSLLLLIFFRMPFLHHQQSYIICFSCLLGLGMSASSGTCRYIYASPPCCFARAATIYEHPARVGMLSFYHKTAFLISFRHFVCILFHPGFFLLSFCSEFWYWVWCCGIVSGTLAFFSCLND